MQTLDELRIGQTHPLSNLSTSSKELSPIEKREFLYRQEMNTEKMFRMGEDSQKAISELVEFKKHEISSIFSANRDYMEGNNQLIESVSSLGDGIYNISSGLEDISKQIEDSHRMNYKGFSSLIKGLGIVNNNIENLEITIEDGVKGIINSINNIGKISTEVLSTLEKIDHKLGNPKKIAGLESKKDAFSYYKNGWYEESLKASDNALEYIFTDYDSYFLQGIIYLEEEKDYKKAKESFEKAIKYSKPENKEIYASSLYKLAIINFIEGDYEKSFSNQLEAIKYNDSRAYWFNLARYSMYVDKKDIFEDALYQALLLDKLNIIKALTDYDFKDHEWKIKIIEKVINNISEEKIKGFGSSKIKELTQERKIEGTTKENLLLGRNIDLNKYIPEILESGNSKEIIFLIENNYNISLETICIYIIKSKNINILQCLINKGFDMQLVRNQLFGEVDYSIYKPDTDIYKELIKFFRKNTKFVKIQGHFIYELIGKYNSKDIICLIDNIDNLDITPKKRIHIIENILYSADFELLKNVTDKNSFLVNILKNGNHLIHKILPNRTFQKEKIDIDKKIKFLIDIGFNINEKNEYGKTPLHQILEIKYHNVIGLYDYLLNIIKILIKYGADLSIPYKSGNTIIYPKDLDIIKNNF